MPVIENSAAPQPRVGLLAGSIPVPLEGVSVAAEITGFCARVVITQRYRNTEARPIEAVYVFPIDELAAVCGFEAISGGVHFVAEVKPRDEAFKIYDDAIEKGHGAYLLDEERADVFTASVGNVPPGAEVLLRITYVTELTAEGAAVRFMLPTTVSPRYAPAEDRTAIGRSQEEVLNPPFAWHVPYGLDVTMDLAMPGTITRVESPSHPVAVALDGARATVTLAQDGAALDRDLVLIVEAAGLDRPHAIVQRDARGQHALALAFRPTFDRTDHPVDVTFLVDRSGSMGGGSIADVRTTLQLCLRSLPAGSRFDIIGFGTKFESLFGRSAEYDERTLAAAQAHVASLDADLGGTEIRPALAHVLERAVGGEMPRQLVIFTDGQVTNTDEVIALVRQHASSTRVFTFGIGRGASAHLVRGIARAGRGAAEFIHSGDRIQQKVLRQFERVLAPAVTDVEIKWDGLPVTQAPASLPPVFSGDRLLVYALAPELRPATIVLSAHGPRGRIDFQIPVVPAEASAGSSVATLAARAMIRDLEESAEALPSRGSLQRGRVSERVTQQIIQLATTYGLASRETSFVAVEHRETPIAGERALRRIPVAVTSGWGGIDQGLARLLAIQPGMVSRIVDSRASAPEFRRAQSDRGATAWLRRFVGSQPDSLDDACDVQVEALQARLLSDLGGLQTRPMDRLVLLQHADGGWDLTRSLADFLQVEFAAIENRLPADVDVREPRRVWATLLALAWLARHAADARDEWRLLARKAERWLADRGEEQTLSGWRRMAAEALTTA